MGNSASTPSSSMGDTSGCPVKQSPSGSDSACPVQQGSGKYKNPNQYNVYSEKIDPTNNMPAQAKQSMAPGQSSPLDTNRVKSNIPKGGTDNDTWTYPSPQMFWNSLVRKGKVEGAEERDMETVVAIHNNMNENTWNQLLAWERLHEVKGEGREPKLLRFMGRPHDLSPKARLKMLFGHPAPFDRHDWIVDRGGEEVRYVIDYYHNEAGVNADRTPKHLQDSESLRSILVDVRPALDSPKSFVDRIFRMPYEQYSNRTEYDPPPFLASPNMGSAPPFTKFKDPNINIPKDYPEESAEQPTFDFTYDEMNEILDKIALECREQKDKLSTCSSEEACGAAAVALQRCSGRFICPTVAKEFGDLIDRYDSGQSNSDVKENDLAESYASLVNCIEHFGVKCLNASLAEANDPKNQ